VDERHWLGGQTRTCTHNNEGSDIETQDY